MTYQEAIDMLAAFGNPERIEIEPGFYLQRGDHDFVGIKEKGTTLWVLAMTPNSVWKRDMLPDTRILEAYSPLGPAHVQRASGWIDINTTLHTDRKRPRLP